MDVLGSNVNTMGPLPPEATAPAAPAPPSITQIQDYLSANPGLSDAQLASAMNQYGVSTNLMSQATGVPLQEVNTRYAAAAPNDYFQAYPDVAAAYASRGTNPAYAEAASLNPDQFAALHYDLFGEGEKRALTPGLTNTLINNLYGSQGVVDPTRIDAAGRDYWTNLINKNGYDSVVPQFAQEALNSYRNMLQNPNGVPNADMLRYGFGNIINSGIANLLEDKKLSLDDSIEARNFLRDYQTTPDKLFPFVQNGSEIVPKILGSYDTNVSGLISKALDPTTSDADRARIGFSLLNKGVSLDEIAAHSNGKLTPQQISGFLDPIKSYGKDFLNRLQSEDYQNADQLSQFLTGNTAARELYAPQRDYFDALAASKSAAATPEQIAAVAKFFGYKNGWEDPNALMASESFRNTFVGKPIADFITYAATRAAGGEQGGPEDIKEKANQLFTPFRGIGVDERTSDEFLQAVANGEISDDVARQFGLTQAVAQQRLKENADPILGWTQGESQDQYRLSQLRSMGVPEDTIQELLSKVAAPSTTPEYLRDPMTGKWMRVGTEGQGVTGVGFNNNQFAANGVHLGGPDGTEKVGVGSQGVYTLDPKTNEVVYRPGITGYQDSSMLRDSIGPILAIASLIPGVAPFAQIANAALSFSKGNVLSGITSLLGASMPGSEAITAADGASKLPTIAQTIGLPSELTTGLNLANAAANKDLFGLLAQGANASGIDLKGMDFAGIPLDKLTQGIAALQALQGGNIGALTGIAGQAFELPELVKASKAMKMAQAMTSTNPYAITQALKLIGEAPRKAEGGLLSESDSDAKVRPYYSGVASLLHGDQEMIHHG